MTTPAVPRRHQQREAGEHERHEQDVDDLHAHAERLDVVLEAGLHRAQLLAYAQLLLLEALDLLRAAPCGCAASPAGSARSPAPGPWRAPTLRCLLPPVSGAAHAPR